MSLYLQINICKFNYNLGEYVQNYLSSWTAFLMCLKYKNFVILFLVYPNLLQLTYI